MSRPNFFQFATKELYQDSFLAWLIRWADASCAEFNPELNEMAQCFVRLLLDVERGYPIRTVVVGRQWEHIDVWAEINECETLVIEDKTWTGEHSGQLSRYRKVAEDYYLPKGYKVHCIYLKTGNESFAKTKAVADQGYRVVSRKDILEILDRFPVKNDLFTDYLEYLTSIEEETNSFTTVNSIHNSWRSSEGFYNYLQKELLPEWSDWGYVANASGGFLGFWYYWRKTKVFPEMYIQIENSDSDIKLVVKVAGDSISTDQLYFALPEIQRIGSRMGLMLEKPRRFRAGGTATLAIVRGAFDSSSFTLDGFVRTLHSLEKVIDHFSA